MSSPGGRKLSAKENEILQRQRQLAARISGVSVNPASARPSSASSQSTSSAGGGGGNVARPTTNRQKQQTLLQQSSQRKRLGEILRPSGVAGQPHRPPPPPPPPSSSSSTLGSKSSPICVDAPPKRATVRQKRPAMRPRPGSAEARKDAVERPASATAALAAARSRLGMKTEAHNEVPAKRPADDVKPVSGSIHKRPRSGKARPGVGGLASLISSSNANTAALKSTKHYKRVEPDDYWRDIRDWDLLKDLCEIMEGQNKPRNGNMRNKRGGGRNGKGNTAKKNNDPMTKAAKSDGRRGYSKDDNKSSSTTNPPDTTSSSDVQTEENKKLQKESITVPLPDKFESQAQYKALWSPLLLAESRAQMLSEISGDIPYWNKKPGKGPVEVSVYPLKKDIGGSTDYITVQIKPKKGNYSNDNGDREAAFMVNDIVLLARNKSDIIDASRGKLLAKIKGQEESLLHAGASLSDKKRKGLLGHTETFRRTLDGLTLKVSRRLWSVLGGQDMFLLRIGCNVTALREYTALCNVDTIPLLGYLLCQKIPHEAKSSKLSSGPNKEKLLADMGGKNALGKGFAKYAHKKFNPSQLGAISAAAKEYGDGGFTLVKGPPGTGKTTTLVALINSLHIRQFNKYFEEVRKIAAMADTVCSNKAALSKAAKAKPRILVCAPSNAAVDNVILKIMEDGFIDGNGCRYNPSMVRIGVGQSEAVKDVNLGGKVDTLLAEGKDIGKLDAAVAGYRVELGRITNDIARLRRRIFALSKASPWPLSKQWEIRIDEETFEETGRVFFVNHNEQRTTYEVPPPPEPDEQHFPATAMPEYRTFMGQIVKLVERYNSITSKLERCTLVQSAAASLAGKNPNNPVAATVRQQLETHILDSVHIVMTTLGTAGNRALESAAKFEVVVVDEAAQSVEPSTLAALTLGSSHAILVGDPQQLPATIFSVSGRGTKYDRSLFQRLEEAGHEVHLLDTQYRMHPAISDFPRRIFYGGNLKDGPNVKHPEYGNPLRRMIYSKFPAFEPFTILDLDSAEERGGTSLSNSAEARLALHLYSNLKEGTGGLSARSRVAVITPYSQQAALLRRTFSQALGADYEKAVEVNTVDAFQGREANIVIFSCVRAAGSRGIGFLSDVRRMNVALTRAKHFMFVIARCRSIVVNPYWKDLVEHARENRAVVRVPMTMVRQMGGGGQLTFPDLKELEKPPLPTKDIVPIKRKREDDIGDTDNSEDGEIS